MHEPRRTIDVSELRDAGVALLERQEAKYLLPPTHLAPVFDWLSANAVAVESAGTTAVTYETCYYDTPDHCSLRGAQQRSVPRWKVRARQYAAGPCFVEAKVSAAGGDFKRRMPRSCGPGDALTDAELDFLAGVEALEAVPLGELTMVASTAYLRRTFVVDGARITVDTSLRCASGGVLLGASDVAVVETKRPPASAPTLVDLLLHGLGVRPGSFSKFADARTLVVDGRSSPGGIPWQICDEPGVAPQLGGGPALLDPRPGLG